MKKKDQESLSPANTSEKIELDLEHQSVQKKNHQKLQSQVLADIEKTEVTERSRRKQGELILTQAFSGAYERSTLERWMVRLSLLLVIQNAAWLLGPVRTNGSVNITFFTNILGINFRPYVCFALATSICLLFTLRLRLKGLYREIIHGMSLANPDEKLLSQIEVRTENLKKLNEAALLPMSMLTVAFGFSFFGWEYAITGIAGIKGFTGFCMASGFALWLGVKRVFQLRDDT
jgi:hypothetical protein